MQPIDLLPVLATEAGSETPARRVERIVEDIAAGRVTPTERKTIRGALDKADAPPTGKDAANQAVGKALRLIP